MTETRRPAGRLPSTDELLEVAGLAFRLAAAARSSMALCGGLAMQLHGSPRLTTGVDVVASGPPPESGEAKPGRMLPFGGVSLETGAGIDINWLERDDEYRGLYDEALQAARPCDEVPSVVTPEHLAAMKLATLRPSDYEDLMFLLGREGLVDAERARDIVYRKLGGKFAADQFDAACEEARWRAERDRR